MKGDITEHGEAWTGGPDSGDVIELRSSPYSEKVLQHGRHPSNYGRLQGADASAIKVGWCGEVMEMYLRIDGDRITQASFWADGCVSTMACGDMLVSMAEGRLLSEAVTISPAMLAAELDGLPFKSQHCAELSVETLREAVAGHQEGTQPGASR